MCLCNDFNQTDTLNHRLKLVTAHILPLSYNDCPLYLALLYQKPRMASVVSDGFSELLVLHTKDFNQMLSKDPELRKQIETIAEQRSFDNQQDG